MSDVHLIRSSTNILLTKGGKVLLSRRKNTGWADGLLCVPGGHVEKDETPRQAAVREVKEELGIAIRIKDLVPFCTASRKTEVGEYVAYEFFVIAEGLEPINSEPELCEELVWVDPEQLPADVITDFAQIIQKGFVNKQIYLEIGY